MEILPDIYQLKIPIPDNPLGFINSYLVRSKDGCLLIDTGWNTDVALESLRQQLEEIGLTFSDLKYIAITHIHPDHYGLVGRLEKIVKAELIIHERERSLLDSRYVNYKNLLDEMDNWLSINGVPKEIRPTLQRASMVMLGLVEVAMPDRVVQGGEHLKIGDFDLEIIWTPGHSPGHICFYERSRKVLFAGDHILPKTTPNVSMNSQTISNPLVDYMNSLVQISKLPIDLVLPGHGDVITDFPARVKAIEQHHENRLRSMLESFQCEPKTAYQVAMATPWYVSWNELQPFNQRMAVTETLAHLELLVARSALTKAMVGGIVWYSVSIPEPSS